MTRIPFAIRAVITGAIIVAGAALGLAMPRVRADWYEHRAEQLVESGDYRSAASFYRSAVDVRPSTSLFQRLARTYDRAHQPEKALAALQSAVKLAPRDAVAHRLLAEELIRQRQQDRAETELEQALALNPKDGLSHLDRSVILRQRGDASGALQELMAAVELGASNRDAHFTLAEAALGRDSRKAEAEYRAAITVDPADGASHLRLGLLLMGENEQEASEHLNTALSLGPGSPQAAMIGRLGLALIAYDEGNFEQARGNLRKTVNEPAPPALSALQAYVEGVLERSQQDLPGAIHDFTTALHTDGSTSSYQAGLLESRLGLYGQALEAIRGGDLTIAERNLQELAHESPGEPEYHLQLGAVALRRGQESAALTQFRVAASLAPEDPEAWLAIANTLQRGGKSTEGASAIERAIRLAPYWVATRPDVDLLTGKLELACGRPQPAMAYLQRAAESQSPLVNPQEAIALLETARSKLLSARTPLAAVPEDASRPLLLATGDLSPAVSPRRLPPKALPVAPKRPKPGADAPNHGVAGVTAGSGVDSNSTAVDSSGKPPAPPPKGPGTLSPAPALAPPTAPAGSSS